MADRNEMCVPLIEGFRLRADDDNRIIEEEVGTDKRVWRVFVYYQKLGIALNDVFTCPAGGDTRCNALGFMGCKILSRSKSILR